MDEFEQKLAQSLRDEKAVSLSPRILTWRGRTNAWRWVVSLAPLGLTIAILAFGFVVASKALPPPDTLIKALMWIPVAVVALLVLSIWYELSRAISPIILYRKGPEL